MSRDASEPCKDVKGGKVSQGQLEERVPAEGLHHNLPASPHAQNSNAHFKALPLPTRPPTPNTHLEAHDGQGRTAAGVLPGARDAGEVGGVQHGVHIGDLVQQGWGFGGEEAKWAGEEQGTAVGMREQCHKGQAPRHPRTRDPTCPAHFTTFPPGRGTCVAHP